MKKIVPFIFFALLTLLFSGCESDRTQEEKAAQSKLPWGRPATWENQLPGFGGAGF